jgi:S-DNA-T family DNA segregation ATPase FtsK/SpoIIIE
MTKYNKLKTVLPLVLGNDISDKTIIKDLTVLPHLLISGRTGTGKTKFIQSLILSMINNVSSSECKLIIFDTKSVEYKDWNNIKHLLCPVINNVYESFNWFKSILQIMDKRYLILSDNKVKNIAEYHKKIPGTDFPYIVIIIDELADFICLNNKQTKHFIQTICSKGRAVGIHVIIATQKTNLPNQIKDFLPVRAVFHVQTAKDSMAILDYKGAENLSVYGDMLFSEFGQIPMLIHSVCVTC